MGNSARYALRRTLQATTALGFALAMPGLALAQADASPQTAAAQANSATGGNEEIVVTARRTAENQQDVPIAITTVTSQALTDNNVRDIIDVQRLTPGLQITSQNSSGRAKLTIRGQSEADNRLTQDGSVGVYIDGVNLARNYGLRSSLVDIAQIEVLKGPQGTLFGRNTTGGAILITTQHPTYEWGGYVDLIYGSYNNAQALAVLNAPLIDDRLALRVVGQVISREGYGQNALGQDVSADGVWNGRVLLRADPSPNVHILLSADYVQQRQPGPSVRLTNDSMLANANTATGALGSIARELGLNPASAADRLTAYNAWRVYYDRYQTGSFYDSQSGLYNYRDDLDHYGVAANIEVDFGPVTARSITAYRRFSKVTSNDTDSTPFNFFQIQRGETHQRIFSQELQLSSIDGTGLDWQAGVFYSRETGNEFSLQNTNDYVNVNRARITDGDIRNISYAAYAQAVLNLTDTLRATGGIRYSRDKRFLDSHNRQDPAFATPPVLAFPPARCNLLTPTLGGPVFPNCTYQVSTDSDAVTWLISADWRPTQDLMFYGSVSTGYRTGGFAVTGSSAVQPSVAALEGAYSPFKPEYVTNYEVGFKSDWFDRRLRVNVAAYYQDYTDIQVQVRGIDNGLLITRYRNAAKATLYGGELEVIARPTDELILNAGVAYLHARYDEFLTLNAAGTAFIDQSDQPFSAPEWTFNLGAAYTIPLPNGSIRLNANYAWNDTVNLAEGAPDRASVTQEGYGLLDGRISWHIDSQNLDIAFFGKNLTNERYITAATNAQSVGWNIAFPGSPRTFGIQVRKTF